MNHQKLYLFLHILCELQDTKQLQSLTDIGVSFIGQLWKTFEKGEPIAAYCPIFSLCHNLSFSFSSIAVYNLSMQ